MSVTKTPTKLHNIIYSVAMSLDGYIARKDGSYDWIPNDPSIDWKAFTDRFDTVLMGRRTYDLVQSQGRPPSLGTKTVVFSRSLTSLDIEGAELVYEASNEAVERIRSRAQKDIWLMGGGELFGTFLELGQVDTIEVAVVPVLLGEGIPLLPRARAATQLQLTGCREHSTGIVLLTYAVTDRS